MPTQSRICVAQTLHAVFGQGSRVPDTWDADLSREDAAFAGALLGLCLRHWGKLQAYVRPRLKNPDRGLPLGTQVVLAMGLAQLAWLQGVSNHAAVHEGAELAKDRAWGFPPHLGLVNALLRAGARDREGLRQELEALPASLDRSPFVEKLLRDALHPWGINDHEALWARLQVPPSPCFRQVKPGPLPEGLVEDPNLAGCLVLSEKADFPREWLVSGAGMVQDRSSQALMSFTWDRPVSRILDVCAAPGGKTTALAMRWPLASLTALEQHPRRARRLSENLEARGIRANVITEEASTWLSGDQGPFDLILLDAPCSGSGTLRKHPELTWIGEDIDLQRLAETQRALLQAAIPKLAHGGLLIYAVCSWLAEEGKNHLPWIREHFPNLKPATAWPHAQGMLDSEGHLFHLNPLRWEGEGFQAFAFTRE